ncbi:MAG: Wzz/FepE/Etk N-terminal domain-containing protein, partial [Candidatus Omnitrophota bacterium]
MSENNQQIKWKNYLRIFLRHKWLFLLPFFSVFTITVVISFLLPKVYAAKAVILVEEDKAINPLLQNLAVSTTVSGRLHQLREEILSWPRVVQLVEELGLNKNKSSTQAFEALITSIRKKISVTMSNQDVIVISYSDQDPAIAQKVVNTISDIFIRKNLTSQAEESSSATDFIKDQLDIYKKKLEVSEEAMRNFKETYGLQMPLAAQINTELARLEAELTTLLVDCTEEHPKVKELRAGIQSLKEKRAQQVRLAAENASV